MPPSRSRCCATSADARRTMIVCYDAAIRCHAMSITYVALHAAKSDIIYAPGGEWQTFRLSR